MLPLVIAGLVALFGWWGNRELRQTIEQQLRSQLTSTLNANVTALEIWTTNQTRLATALAGQPRCASLPSGFWIVPNWNPAPPKAAPTPRTSNSCAAILTARGSRSWATKPRNWSDTNFVIVASSMRAPPGPPPKVSESHTNKFAELFSSGEPVIITPFKPELLSERRAAGFFGNGGTNAFRRGNRFIQANAARGRRGNVSLMQVAAPLIENGIV